MRRELDGQNGNRGRRVSRFAWRLEREWRALGLPEAKQRLVIAVSGGPDSTALLLAMQELWLSHRLELPLTAANLDHGLRGNAGAEDAEWLRELTGNRGISLVTERVDVAIEAARSGDNLEQAARRMRYDFLEQTAAKLAARYVLTAHTMDDQAETVLLRLMRGSGLEGLGGMRPIRQLLPGSNVELVRPLIASFRREEILEYCRDAGVEPRQDAMNSDPAFSRVAVRQQLLPVMERFNPRTVETLVRTARLLREDAAVMQPATAAFLSKAICEHHGKIALSITKLREAPSALRNRVIRSWLEMHRGGLRRIEAVHVRAVGGLLNDNVSGRIVEIPGGGRVERLRDVLFFQEMCNFEP